MFPQVKTQISDLAKRTFFTLQIWDLIKYEQLKSPKMTHPNVQVNVIFFLQNLRHRFKVNFLKLIFTKPFSDNLESKMAKMQRKSKDETENVVIQT